MKAYALLCQVVLLIKCHADSASDCRYSALRIRPATKEGRYYGMRQESAMSYRGKVGLRIFERGKTISAELVKLVEQSQLPAAAVADAQGKLSGVTRGRIRKISGPDGVLAGPVMTVKAAPLDNLLVHKAIDLAQPGDVIVVDAGGNNSGAIVGELVAMTAEARGVKALIIDGAVRDVSTLQSLKVAIYATGVSPLGPQKNGPGEINIPIACDGAVVMPGDLVVMDADGLVFVRPEDGEVVLKSAREIVDHEEGRKKDISSGNLERPWVEILLTEKGV